MNNQNLKKNVGAAGSLRIAVVAYEGVELFDTTGPIEVFTMLNRCLSGDGTTAPGYDVIILAERAGTLATSSGVRLVADASWHDMPEDVDTLIVVGSPDDPLEKALGHRDFVTWLRSAGKRVRRLVSVCTGAFLLAEAGLLDGRRATTHWMDLDRLRREYPHVIVETDAIYVRDGYVATSAGVTACMDLALSLVEEDFGRKMALTVARRLVMYLKRPGGQAQFSTQLRSQMVDDGPLAPLLAWLRENSHCRLTVEEMADRAAMSPRNFARVFLRETCIPPAKYIEQLRLERAMGLLEDTSHTVETVARESGFIGAEQMRRAFLRHVGITPVAYRQRF
jgi:transcriptional regulator GlxA family with amidase domain